MIRSIDATIALALLLSCSYGRAGEPPVTALAFTPEGNVVVYGSQAGLSVRSATNSAATTKLETSLEQIHDVQFSPAGDRLAVAGGIPAEEGVLEVLNWPLGDRRTRLTIGEDLLYSVIWIDDGKKAALAGFDGTSTLVDVDEETVSSTLTGHSRSVTTVCHAGITDSSNDGFLLVTGSVDQTLRVWKPTTGESIRTLHNHTAPLHGLALRPTTDGLPVVASISDDRTVRFWQPTIGRMMRFVRLQSVPLCLAWSDENSLLVGCADGHVRRIDPNTAAVLMDERVLDGRILSIAVNAEKSVFAVGGLGGDVRIWPTQPKAKR